MLLVLDVGNTNIKSGLFQGDELMVSWRIATERNKTSDEYGLTFMELLHYAHKDVADVDAIMISSVVPSINYTLEHMFDDFFHVQPMIVSTALDIGIAIGYDIPGELGTDRIVNAVAAYAQVGGACIVIDFGTATTFGAVSSKGEFLGGAIAPGIKVATEALSAKAALLPKIEFMKTDKAINTGTIANMQSGIIHGYVGLVNHMVARFKAEMREENVKVIATGGMSHLIGTGVSSIDVIDDRLTLKGLQLLYARQQREA